MAKIVAVAEALEPALRVLKEGRTVALPTETVYGLAADATSGEAVARIYEAKRRPSFNPLIAHVCDLDMAERLALLNPLGRQLADAFWPGPLTLVLPLREDSGIHPLVTAGLSSIAIRMPRGFARDLIRAFGRPIAAPSANSSGRVSATSAGVVEADLGEKVTLIVDGGPTPVGIESTIVSVLDGRLRILRPGGVTAEEIRAATGIEPERAGTGEAVQSPGMLASHYAPDAPVRLNAASVEPDEALLAFGPRRARGAASAGAVLNLSEGGDLREAAANLYAHLIALDAGKPAGIAVEPIPETGLGEAINDRLRRAAAPRGGD